MGRPRQWQRLRGEAESFAASSRTVNELANKLGVSRQTVYRWRQAGKLPAKPQVVGQPDPPPEPKQEAFEAGAFETWARSRYVLSRTELELARLADAALTMAHSTTETAGTRLAAMREFRSLATALSLPKLESDEEQDGDTPATIYPFPREA